MKILIQFPTLGRPEKFLSCIKKYISMSSGKHKLVFNVNCDTDDASMERVSNDVIGVGADHSHVMVVYNQNPNKSKIDAINVNIDAVKKWDIVVCASDDMIPSATGWDDYIVRGMMENFPELDGCVHFDDSHTADKLITFSILGRQLYQHFGYIYHPDYKALYCDDEFTQEVKRLNKVAYIDKVIVKHEHYGEQGNSNTGDLDFAAKKTLHYSGRDHQVFNARVKLGFPKERITND